MITVVVTYSNNSVFAGREHTFSADKAVLYEGFLRFSKIGFPAPYRCISMNEIAQFFVKEPVVFETKMEEYLSENLGRLSQYYELITNEARPGNAFARALCRPDSYRIRKADRWEALLKETEFDSPKILETIEFLKKTAADYPEDHPLWSLR
jgi:hypothetical protein